MLTVYYNLMSDLSLPPYETSLHLFYKIVDVNLTWLNHIHYSIITLKFGPTTYNFFP